MSKTHPLLSCVNLSRTMRMSLMRPYLCAARGQHCSCGLHVPRRSPPAQQPQNGQIPGWLPKSSQRALHARGRLAEATVLCTSSGTGPAGDAPPKFVFNVPLIHHEGQAGHKQLAAARRRRRAVAPAGAQRLARGGRGQPGRRGHSKGAWFRVYEARQGGKARRGLASCRASAPEHLSGRRRAARPAGGRLQREGAAAKGSNGWSEEE